MRFILFGAKGFLGRNIKRSLLEMGHIVLDVGRDTDVVDIDGQYDFIIDATSQKKLSELNHLVQRVDYVVEKCGVRQVIVLSSFSTLQSKVQCSELFNFGSSCQIFTPYTAIKQHKEKLYLNRIKSTRVKFIYLPIILGQGGVWSRVLSKGNLTNYVPKLTNIFVINASDIAKSILTLTKKDLSRCLAYEIYSWRDLLNSDRYIDVDANDLGLGYKFKFLFRNENISYVGYVLAAIFMKLRYKNYLPNLFYWFVFYMQDKCIHSFSKYNLWGCDGS